MPTLSKFFDYLIAIDMVAGNLEFLENTYNKVPVEKVCKKVQHYVYNGRGTVKGAIGIWVMCYLSASDMMVLFRRTFDCLKSGGYFIINEPIYYPKKDVDGNIIPGQKDQINEEHE